MTVAKKMITRLSGRVGDGAVCLSFYAAGGSDLSAPMPVRVWREEHPAFTFNKDYGEYFHGLRCPAEHEIFSGTLIPVNGRKFEFRDGAAAIGHTYAYWIRHEDDDEHVGPIALRIRDPRVWWTAEEIGRRLTQLAERFPGRAEVLTFGRSVEGRPLRGVIAGNRERLVGFVGLVHAGESGPELIIPALEGVLGEHEDLLRQAGIAVLPCVNLDNRNRLAEGVPWYLRTNAAGVDLNRNFDAGWDMTDYSYGLDSSDRTSMTYRGPTPASEPETLAVMNFVAHCKPHLLFSMHCLSGICGDSFLTAKAAEHDTAFLTEARAWAETYRHGMYPDATAPLAFSCGCSTGSLPGWLYRHARIPGFDLELGTNEDARPCVTDQTTPELLSIYRQRHLGGMRSVLLQMSHLP